MMRAGQKQKKVDADVIIIGGGITGILSAYLLSQSGKKVVLLEKKSIGSGATKYTTAFITQVIDTSFTDLISIYGLPKTKLIIDSHRQAIDLIASIVSKERIECQFKTCSNYEYANSLQELGSLTEEYHSCQRLDMDVNFSAKPKKLGFDHFGSIEFKNQAKFLADPFLHALANAFIRSGANIYEKTQALSFQSDGREVKVETTKGIFVGKWLIVATYEPFTKPLRFYFKKAFYTSYVFKASIPAGAIKEAIYEDSLDPYHYFRVDKNQDKSDSGSNKHSSEKDILIIGGEDHRSDIHVSYVKNYRALEQYLKTILKGIPYVIAEKWTGPILESVDGLPFIGSMAGSDKEKNVLYAMAFSGNGMTYSGIASMIFTDTILRRKNIWKKIYGADRLLKLKALMLKGKDYVKEFASGALKNSLKYKKEV